MKNKNNKQKNDILKYEKYEMLEHINNINTNGFTIVKNKVKLDLIDRVVRDFNYWSSIPENGYTKFNLNRVVNFHVYSGNTLDLAANNYVNELLKTMFNTECVIYSSLFFREGTIQQFHRDTPHFYTSPVDKYCVVWYALEDININAGPLKYYIESHKLDISDGYSTFNKVYENEPNKDDIDITKDFKCIIEYNKTVVNLCEQNNLKCVNEKNYVTKINKGDIFIMHPKLVHGGSDIIDNTLTRFSMQLHWVPVNTQVFNAKHFFSKEATPEYLENKCTYNYINHNNIKIVDHSVEPFVQKTYA